MGSSGERIGMCVRLKGLIRAGWLVGPFGEDKSIMPAAAVREETCVGAMSNLCSLVGPGTDSLAYLVALDGETCDGLDGI